MLAPYGGREEKAASENAGAPTPASSGGEDPRLKRLEAQIDALTKQLDALGRDPRNET